MAGILLFLGIAGATGLFLFGMKLMSESLQKVMGNRIRSILTSMTSNKFKAVIAGLLITTLIQSSSATTIIVVSFVNAGFLHLVGAVGVIMGANIGTTLTAWLISFVGFEINIAAYTLPFIGLSIPMLYSNKRKLKSWGEMVLGFSLLFISINFLKEIIPFEQESWISELINNIASLGYLSYIAFLIVGAILTILIRSSIAIFAITVVLVINGWLNFEYAAAMVLGENIGTTIAAISAARVANITAKRAALAHLFFNLFGVFWIITIFPFYLNGLSKVFIRLGGQDPFLVKEAIPLALALFHTSFNVLNTLILIGFSGRISNFVRKRIPTLINAQSEFKLTHIKIGLLSTPDASIYQARRETIVFAETVRKMFINIENLFDESGEKKEERLIKLIVETEDFSNRLEKEIANYLTKVGEGRLSESSSRKIRGLFKMIDDIESIADSCVNIKNVLVRKKAQKIFYSEQIKDNIHLMFKMVRNALDIMINMISHDRELPLSVAMDSEKEINNFRDILKSEHLINLEKGVYKYDAGIIYNDIISQCERIGDYAINVDESFKNQF